MAQEKPPVIVGPPAFEIPLEQGRPFIEIKPTWQDDWEVDPSLIPLSASVMAAASGIGSMKFQRKYGATKRVYDDDFEDSESIDLTRYWIRIKFAYAQGDEVIWVGRVSSEIREFEGGDTSHDGEDIAAGGQVWVAYGPMDLLRRIEVSKTWWWVEFDEEEQEAYDREGDLRILGTLEPVNIRDRQGMLVGNRSEKKHDKAYMFGGTDEWSRLDFVEYVLDRHANINQDAGTNPQWTIAGQTDALEHMIDQIDLRGSASVLEILRTIISPKINMDFWVDYTDDGFEIVVFALSDTSYGFGGFNFPKNTDKIRMNVSDTIDLDRPTITKTHDHVFGKIRVLGDQIVIVTSLRGAEAPGVGEEATLVEKWDVGLEIDYENAVGAKDFSTEQQDAARQRDRYRTVYQRFGMPEGTGIPAPALDRWGNITQEDQEYQETVRETLPYTVLLEGYDYSEDPPTNENPENAFPDFLPPQVWIEEDLLEIYEGSETIPVQELVALEQDWGVFLQMEINHLIAKGHFSAVADTALDPYYDYETLIATIAVRSRQRLVIEYQTYPDDDFEDYSVHEIVNSEAQLWVLAPHTVVGIGTDPDTGEKGVPIDSGPKWRVLRNDAEQLYPTMAAAMSRYIDARSVANIPSRLLLPWGGLLGKILMEVEDEGDIAEIRAPVTNVTWSFGTGGGTTLFAGHAQ